LVSQEGLCKCHGSYKIGIRRPACLSDSELCERHAHVHSISIKIVNVNTQNLTTHITVKSGLFHSKQHCVQMAGWVQSECSLRQWRLVVHFCIVIHVLRTCTPTGVTQLMGPGCKSPVPTHNKSYLSVSLSIPDSCYCILFSPKIIPNITHSSSSDVDCHTRILDIGVLIVK
jgi:hypothetical protein